MRLPRVDTVSCMTAKFEPTGGCYCGEIYHEYGMDDCIFRNIVRPAFARAVCAALALSPLKLTEDKAWHLPCHSTPDWASSPLRKGCRLKS